MSLIQLSYNFTRPGDTSSYQDTDLVANSTTAGSVVPMSWVVGGRGGRLVHARLEKTDASDVANATFTLHLFGASPTVANGDNGAISYNISKLIGTLPFAIMTAKTDDASSQLRVGDTSFLYPIACPHPVVYGLLEAKAAYSPANQEVFTCVLTFDK